MNNHEFSRKAMQLVVFLINNALYALEIKYVQSIEKVSPITRVPGSEDFILGVINLRGEIVPVMDTHLRLNIKSGQQTESSRIIICSLDDFQVGLTADAVVEILSVEDNHMQKSDELLQGEEKEYIKWISEFDKRIISILDVNKILQKNEVQ